MQEPQISEQDQALMQQFQAEQAPMGRKFPDIEGIAGQSQDPDIQQAVLQTMSNRLVNTYTMNIEQQEAHQAPPQRFLKSVINQSKKEPQIDPR